MSFESWEGPSKAEFFQRWMWKHGDGSSKPPSHLLSHQFSRVPGPWNKAYMTHSGMDFDTDYDGRGDATDFGQGPS